LNVLLHLAFLVLASGLMVGIHSMAMEVVDGRMPHLKLLTASLERGPRYLLAFCLYFLSVVVGLLLLVVPGVYVAVRYALFGQVFATKQTSTLGALRDAGSLSRGQWWAMCRVLVAALALNLAGAALLGLGLVISFPISLLVASSLFRTLQHTLEAFDHAQPNHVSGLLPQGVGEEDVAAPESDCERISGLIGGAILAPGHDGNRARRANHCSRRGILPR
jgi:hypothetical protein